MSEHTPLIPRRHSSFSPSAFSPALSSSLPLSSPYLPLSYAATSTNPGTHATATPPAAHSPYYQQAAMSMPQSPNPPRRPLDRIHHLPPPHLIHSNSLPIPPTIQPPNSSTSSSLLSTPHAAASPSRLSSLLSLSSITSSPAPSTAQPPETKRVEVVPDRLGKPSVREEREWPKPKKDAQYDDDALLDYHSLLVLFVLLVTSVVLYFGFPAVGHMEQPGLRVDDLHACRCWWCTSWRYSCGDESAEAAVAWPVGRGCGRCISTARRCTRHWATC